MSKLYWMEQIIATTDSEYLQFDPGSLSGLHSTTVGGALREVASSKTGIVMSTTVPAGAISFAFNNSYFNDNMYAEYYTDHEMSIGFPVYDDSLKTITFACEPPLQDTVVRLVVQF